MAARRYRIGIGGIAIESSTFSPHPSSLADFTILRGAALGSRYPFMPDWRFRGRDDIDWLPGLYARSLPGGPVVASAYAAMRDELLDRLRATLPLDGLYLDLHGAMAVDGLDDAEAQGPSKRLAEQAAAEAFLRREGLWSETMETGNG